jgi:hypothetical protein
MALAVAGSVAATAEPMRTLLVQENKVPNDGKFEVGGLFLYQEITDDTSLLSDASYTEFGPYARYGVTKDFSLNLAIPFARSDLADGDNFGVGDLELGADLVGFEDALGYPYVMPYVRLALPTGDDEEGLGAGETQFRFGVSIGTTVDDNWDFVADLGYVGRSETDNSLRLGGAIAYSFSKKFSVHLEGIYDIPDDDEVDELGVILGGMIYRPAELWMIGIYGGVETGDVDENVVVAAKLAYFWE